MPKQPEPLGQVQLDVLRYIAEHHPIRVGAVAEYFAATEGKARTTILTVMEKLRQKGYLTRKKMKGVFHYEPRLGQKAVMSSVVRRFINESLGGSVSPLIAYLSETHGLTDAELSKLKQLVREMETRRKEEHT